MIMLGTLVFHNSKITIDIIQPQVTITQIKLLIHTSSNSYDAYFIRKFVLLKPNSYDILFVHTLKFVVISVSILLDLIYYLTVIQHIYQAFIFCNILV